MKKIKYLFLIVLYCSCSVTKNNNAPINDYLESQKVGDQKIMIIQEKINNNTTIDIFKGKFYFEPLSNKYERNEGIKEPLFVKTKWEKMKSKYESKYITDFWIRNNNWTSKDFKIQNILFFERAKFPNPGEYEKFNFDDYYIVFSFSEPIYYAKKYAVFTVQKTNTTNMILGNTSILVLEKKDGKWVVVQGAVNGVYN
ncbi:hypothetical protein [Flavobacterium hibernum]|uniref:Uncharacterized protein n=1 Tax=Flavobacterium hibernum TaxID=37752 RepID=A0A0D0EES3_9FLAO|nr:hypothetical protein [Flavobacterium hibernum]KIO52854.1 hypothetical protein IW18_09940 [Flavobacterium hibernum]OXA88491.1 hypothetical protein B0A73_07350 [Flavobacterium hibernum]STO15382.1 Uncharacterised protein [Flavobacterium hibernum]